MPRIPGADKAIDNLIAWSQRDEWMPLRSQIFDAHFGPVCERFDLTEEDVADILGPEGFAMFAGFVLEDFFTARFGEEGDNVVDDYLKRRGWREKVPAKRYLQALRDARPSLYEVVDLEPGRHLVMKDLIEDNEPVIVEDKLGSETAALWDRIAARIVTVNNKHYLTGAMLHFAHELAEDVLVGLSETTREFEEKVKAEARGTDAADLADEGLLRDFVLEFRPHLFTSAWLADVLLRATSPLPEVRNRDGEELVFTEVRFPVKGDTEELIRRLDSDANLDRVAEDVWRWSWLQNAEAGDRSSKGEMRETGLTLHTEANGESWLLGSIELDDDSLVLSTNSSQRAERGRQHLATLLEALVGLPQTSMHPLEQLMAERKDESPPAEELPPEVAAGVIRGFYDRHYRRSLDEAIPYFDGKTPRQAARSKEGRDRVIAWLKMLENSDGRRAAVAGPPPYDFTWMWEELGVLDGRR